ncbi:tetratricopeptide repeat protein [Oxynema aestuarii]|uniref:Tetratricopeptide repeat protein n=1 Tax=Oxynema aestuarii AP17 TaxID=2064643 RepID=A0A6H1TWB9_9CYAN|nr:tetratricopeptide repeat protein [Oxynema aestuarii]QIZ70884.1 tetratricopeptide repeat protein [Oxynema aestuarii AP17]
MNDDYMTAITVLYQSLDLLQKIGSAQAQPLAKIIERVKQEQKQQKQQKACLSREHREGEDSLERWLNSLDEERRHGVNHALASEIFSKSNETQQRMESERLYEQAESQAKAGQTQEAIALCRQALELERRVGNVQGQPQILTLLGQLLALMGDYDRALSDLQEAWNLLARERSIHTDSIEEIIVEIIISRWQQLHQIPGENFTEEKLIQWIAPLSHETMKRVISRLEQVSA